MKISYKLTEEARNKLYIETGIKPEQRQTLTLDDTKLTPLFRAFWLTTNTGAGDLAIRSTDYDKHYYGWSTDSVAASNEDAIRLLSLWRADYEAAELKWREVYAAKLDDQILGLRAAVELGEVYRDIGKVGDEFKPFPRYAEAVALVDTLRERMKDAEQAVKDAAQAEREKWEAEQKGMDRGPRKRQTPRQVCGGLRLPATLCVGPRQAGVPRLYGGLAERGRLERSLLSLRCRVR